MIKIKIINLIFLLSLFNNNLNSMQQSNIEESENTCQDLSSTQINNLQETQSDKQNLTLLNLPEEIIQYIIYQIIEPYTYKTKNTNNIIKLYSVDVDQINKVITKSLINLLLTSKVLNSSTSYVLEFTKNKIENLRKKQVEFENNIKCKYEYKCLNKLQLYNKLIFALNKSCANLEKAVKLIIAGAHVDLKNCLGQTALIEAIKQGRKNIFKLLLNKGANINTIDEDEKTALILAIKKNHQDLVELLVNKGADINASNKNGNTALIIAAYKGNKDIIELLLNKGADINASDNNRNTALIAAAYRGNKDIIELLLNKEADINAINSCGDNALTLAKINDHKEIIELLLNKGANINARSYNGYTALILAIIKNNCKTVKVLLNMGVDVEGKDNDGNTPLMIAEKSGCQYIAELIKNYQSYNNNHPRKKRKIHNLY